MRAMVYTRPNVVEMQDVGFPAADDGEVLVNVANVGICGSELHGIADTEFRKPPLIMGHEFAGTTADGRRVVVNPLLSCGHCDQCMAGRDHLCRTRRIVGIHRPGAFAEAVPVPASSVHEIPDSMSFETAAMVEPLANAVHAVALARVEPDARIAVIGAGPIGSSAPWSRSSTRPTSPSATSPRSGSRRRWRSAPRWSARGSAASSTSSSTRSAPPPRTVTRSSGSGVAAPPSGSA